MSSVVPDGWSKNTINECCEILDSQRVPVNSEERAKRKGDYPYYGANGVQGYIDDYIFEGDAILLAEDGGNFDQYADRPIAQWVTGKFWVNNHAHILRAKDNATDKWIFYSLVHKNILKNINGGTRAKLNQSDLKEIEILLSPLPEQKKIASILTSVDEVIENTQKQIDKLQDLKKATMNELLTKGIGHTEFKDSELGRIPKSWEVVTLSEIILSLDGGVSVNGQQRPANSAEVGVLKVSCVKQGRFIPSENKVIEDYDRSRAKLNPCENTILISRANTPELVGESGYVERTRNDLFLPDKIWALRLNDSKNVDMRWLSSVLTNGETRRSISDAATGTSSSMRNISKANLLQIKISLPPVLEQIKISRILRSLDAKRELFAGRLNKVKTLKKSLMQDLLTGKVRVTVN